MALTTLKKHDRVYNNYFVKRAEKPKFKYIGCKD